MLADFLIVRVRSIDPVRHRELEGYSNRVPKGLRHPGR